MLILYVGDDISFTKGLWEENLEGDICWFSCICETELDYFFSLLSVPIYTMPRMPPSGTRSDLRSFV